MSSVTDNLPPPIPPTPAPAEQSYVDDKIRRTRRALKVVDLVAGLITLTIGVLCYLLTMALLEHWIVPGGLSTTVRALLLLILLGGVIWYGWRYFWPLLSQQINPIYAAHTIEQGSPSLKNSLLNLLLLRDRRRQISRQVYQAIETQAAQRLAEVPIDTAVDRSAVLRLGYVLVAVLGACLLYRIVSPKDPVASAVRLLNPWSNIPVPSRVQIQDVQPGDTSAARGEQVIVTAEVLGKDEDEPVRLVYSQTDGQIVDQEIVMTGSEDSLRYKCRLPGRIAMGSGGIQNDLTYRIEAGDARSPDYKISVFSQPTLVVERVRYEYPIYTGYPPREEEFAGDISAVEGTVVTLYAVANQPIDNAHVDFEADGRHDLLMNSKDTSATVRFPLELKEDRRTPKHQSYVLRYTTTEGRRNPAPPKYQIDVQRDLSPEIELLEPQAEVLNVGLNDEVVLKLEARDPDFALHNVAILGEVAGDKVLKKALLTGDHSGRFEGQLKIVPAELDLKEGAVLEYWGAAADNRRPEPNIMFTKHQKLRIIGPGQREPLPNGQQDEEQSGEGQQGESGQGEQGQQGENQEGNAGGAGDQDQQGDSSDQQQGSGGEGQQGEGSDQSQQQEGQQGGNAESQGESTGENGGSAEGQSGGEQQQDTQQQEGSQQQGDNQSGAGDSSGQPSENSRVSPDGDNDGEAFDRIADHFQEQDQQNGSNEAGDSQAGADQQQQPGDQQNSPDAGNSGSQEQQGTEQSASPDEQQAAADNAPQDQGGQGERSDARDSAGSEQDDTKTAEQQQTADGQGADGEGDQEQQSEQRDDTGDQEQGDSPSGGELNKEQGDAGAGRNPGDNKGSPSPDEMKKPKDKNPGQNENEQLDDQEAPFDSQDKKESDSEGGQSGENSGGGQEGGGQQADDQGTGAAGQNQSAEDGAGQSPEQGEGETGKEAGDQTKSEGQTGESSGDQQGEGSEQGQQAGEQTGGEQTAAGQEGGQPGESPAQAPDGQGQPERGGTGSNTSPPPSSGESLGADEANLDYAREQTDLVLNRLEDQLKKREVDQELLDKLGWTPDELQQFVNRWKNLKARATGAGPDATAAEEELEMSLRSLGLDKNRQQGFQARSAKDRLRDLKDSFRGRTPLEFEKQMRIYVKGTASAGEEQR